MAKNFANVEVASDSFNSWVNRTNDILTTLRNEVLTANATSAASQTTGNAELIGTFSANTIKATTVQGGNTTANTLLNVYGNVSILSNSTNFAAFKVTGGSSVATGLYANADEIILAGNAAGNSAFSVRSNTSFTVLLATGNSSTTNVFVNSSATTITSNLAVTGSLHTVAGNVNFDTGTLYVDSVNNRIGVNNTTPDASMTVTGTANVSGNTIIGGRIVVTGNATFSNLISVTGAATLSNTLTVTGLSQLNGDMTTVTANASSGVNVGANVNLSTTQIKVGNSTQNTSITSSNLYTSGTLTVVNAASFSNTLGVTGAVTLSNTANVVGRLTGSDISASNFALNSNDSIITITSNGDIGSTTGSPVSIYSFPYASYSSGKLIVQVKKGSNTQVSEALVAHDGTTAYITAFGTVVSPTGLDLGDLSANIVSTNVEIYLNPNVANSAVRVVAQLIK